jgi:hypothetical protein
VTYEETLNKEEPAPAFIPVKATKAQQAKGKDRGDNVGDAETCPEERQAEWQFSALEEVRLHIIRVADGNA